MKTISNIWPILLVITLACSGPALHDHEEEEDGPIQLTPAQIAQAGIRVGKAEIRSFAEVVACTGMIDVPPQSLASVMAPTAAFVKKTNFLPGDYVRKGQVLAILQHPNLIDLQQQYLQALSGYRMACQQFERLSGLREEDAVSEKDFQAAENEYKQALARKQGLEAHLKMIGFVPERIETEGIRTELYVMAPISGYITENNINPGKLVEPGVEMYRMVDKDHVHVELSVFEKDVARVKPGQHIRFLIPGSKEWFEGHVKLVGQVVSGASRTVSVHAHPEEEMEVLKPGMFVQAEIYVSEVKHLALPEDALIREDGKTYAFEKTEEGFEKIQVQTGLRTEGWVQVMGENLAQKEFVMKGAYYLQEPGEDDDH
jgi:membrane fusion protein, heavy metal efflux system